MSLSDTKLRNIKGREKAYKLADVLGLYAFVKPNGSILWRMDFQFGGKRKTLSIGKYPAVSLRDARLARDRAQQLLDGGRDPTIQKKLDKIADVSKAANTFSVIAAEYMEKCEKAGQAAGTLKKKRWIIDDLCQELSERPIADIKPVDILPILQRADRKGFSETAKKAKSIISGIFRLAVATTRAENDPTLVLKGAVAAPVPTHHAAITDEKGFGALMRSIDDYTGWPTVRLALKFTALTAARPGEVRLAHWDEFDLAKRTWTVPAGRTKMRREHVVPLCRQAVAIIEEIEPITRGDDFVFASIRSGKKALSENAMNSALKRMGYRNEDHVSHGFRSSFSTIMNERGHDFEIIEHALAHKDSSIRGIYNRSKYWDDRVALMQTWGDLVDELSGVKVEKPKLAPAAEEFEDLLGIENPGH